MANPILPQPNNSPQPPSSTSEQEPNWRGFYLCQYYSPGDWLNLPPTSLVPYDPEDTPYCLRGVESWAKEGREDIATTFRRMACGLIDAEQGLVTAVSEAVEANRLTKKEADKVLRDIEDYGHCILGDWPDD